MSFTLHGIAVSSGIAIGRAHMVTHTSLEVVYYFLPEHLVHEELERFDSAMEATRKGLAALREARPQQAAAEFDAFLDLHLMILDDEHISKAAREMIARDKNHPSVILWSLANEPHSDHPDAKPFFRTLYDLAKSLDATRPATLVSMKWAREESFDIIR